MERKLCKRVVGADCWRRGDEGGVTKVGLTSLGRCDKQDLCNVSHGQSIPEVCTKADGHGMDTKSCCSEHAAVRDTAT